MERLQQIENWLNIVLHCQNIHLVPVSGDASFRRYYQATHDSRSYIVMDAPPKHEDCSTFIDITARLASVNINVPQILASDFEQGFLLLSDLGGTLYLDCLNQRTANSLYTDAFDALLKMQTKCNTSGLPNYDEKLLRQEAELFTDWLLEKHLTLELPTRLSHTIQSLTDLLVESALEQPRVFVHRDYHSRNLVQTPNNNPGILDYQDAVLGPVTYDLVSLLKDCYIKWPNKKTRQWARQYYQRLNMETDWGAIEESQFLRWFDLMGVQRHLKASGIFARLFHRDGKAGYLKDVPRTLRYILDLRQTYPELQSLCAGIERYVLPALEKYNPSCAQ